MKEKLTKNDSISSSEMSADVMLAAFDALLSRNALLIDYYAMWAKRRKLNYGDTIRQQFYVWAGCVKPDKWVLSAFDFSKSHIPHQVWYMISNKWIDWLKQNLNK